MSRALLFRALCVLVTHPSGDASRILAEVTLPESNFYPSDWQDGVEAIYIVYFSNNIVPIDRNYRLLPLIVIYMHLREIRKYGEYA